MDSVLFRAVTPNTVFNEDERNTDSITLFHEMRQQGARDYFPGVALVE